MEQAKEPKKGFKGIKFYSLIHEGSRFYTQMAFSFNDDPAPHESVFMYALKEKEFKEKLNGLSWTQYAIKHINFKTS